MLQVETSPASNMTTISIFLSQCQSLKVSLWHVEGFSKALAPDTRGDRVSSLSAQLCVSEDIIVLFEETSNVLMNLYGRWLLATIHTCNTNTMAKDKLMVDGTDGLEKHESRKWKVEGIPHMGEFGGC